MFDREIRTDIDIAARPEQVWDVLTALDQWSQWNPVLAGIVLDGSLREGARGRLSVELPPPVGRRSIAVRLVTVRPREELAWQGGVAGVVEGRHGFRLEATDLGTRVIHSETFSGVMAPALVALLRRQLERRYRRLNRGLRERCERS